VAQLCQHQDDLERLKAKVLLISFGTLPAAQAWLEETRAPFTLVLDPTRTTYQAYGLERSFLRSWNLRTFLRYVELIRAGRQWRGIQGDSAQLGGDFIVDAQGVVRLAYRSHDPADRPSVEMLLEALRVIQGEVVR